jgi:uncharacterized membrane protein (UPF0127 family)
MMLRNLAVFALALVGLTAQAGVSKPFSTDHLQRLAPTTSSECPNTAVDTTKFLSSPTVGTSARLGRLRLAVVNDEDGRARGLMCVTRIPHGRGMIFVFAPPDASQNFWMKNTLVPLDMLFVHGDGTVDSVAANVPATPNGTPDDKIARRGGIGQFVIELGAGDAARLGITSGTKLVLPPLQAKN